MEALDIVRRSIKRHNIHYARRYYLRDSPAPLFHTVGAISFCGILYKWQNARAKATDPYYHGDAH